MVRSAIDELAELCERGDERGALNFYRSRALGTHMGYARRALRMALEADMSALFEAVAGDDRAEGDAKPDVREPLTEDNWHALHFARSVHMVGRLLGMRARLDATDIRGLTPLMVAAREGNEQVAAALLEAGANVNAACARGRSAIFYAADKPAPSEAIIVELVRRGARLRVADRDGVSLRRVARTRGAAWLLAQVLDEYEKARE